MIQELIEYEGYHQFGNELDGYGSFEVFWDDPDFGYSGQPRNFDRNGNPVQAGWYWWARFPGCLPDGDATGPFKTPELAYRDARGEL